MYKRQAIGRWHWVVAFRHSAFGIAVFDPHQTEPSFQQIPMDVLCFDFRIYEPKGTYLQVEQRIALEKPLLQESLYDD